MSINFHQLTQTVLTIPKLKRPARSCASLTAGPACLHLPAYADVQTIKNEYGVKMSIRANAGIMKDENRSKARKKAGQDWGKIGNKSECGYKGKGRKQE